jgi:uncharacterized protein
MKKIVQCVLLLLLSTALCFGQPKKEFDAELAAKLGADDYGMKKYVFAFLKSGPTKIDDAAKRKDLQVAHLKNIQRMAEEGKLVVAGPFLDNQPIRGIYIFNVTTVEEAKKLVETDPSIQAGTLEMELHPWYGSAALMEVTRIHYMLEKVDITK